MAKKIVIIGAGPAGLGAAYRLKELGYQDFKVFEKNGYVGGLAASFKDEKGFTWDIGGHVIFSHYHYFDRLLDLLLGNDYREHQRRAYIWVMQRWVPYPFQNNLRYLPFHAAITCLTGLCIARLRKQKPENFKEWINSTFGSGIARYFMLPQNNKTWKYSLEKMSYQWIVERISVIDVRRIIRNMLFFHDDIAWGPNNRFKFPLSGGTGEIFRRLSLDIVGQLNLNRCVTGVDIGKKEIIFKDGGRESYDILFSTMPLKEFISIACLRQFFPLAEELQYNSVAVVGLGIRQICPSNKCWMYFPENDCPFYRVTYFSNYSPNNTPEGSYYSLLCEVAYQGEAPEKEKIIEDTIEGLINTKILSAADRKNIISRFVFYAPYAYPIPTLGRDRALSFIQPYLEQQHIYSRGRFGAWKYEAGNMDHSFMQGVEVAEQVAKKT